MKMGQSTHLDTGRERTFVKRTASSWRRTIIGRRKFCRVMQELLLSNAAHRRDERKEKGGGGGAAGIERKWSLSVRAKYEK